MVDVVVVVLVVLVVDVVEVVLLVVEVVDVVLVVLVVAVVEVVVATTVVLVVDVATVVVVVAATVVEVVAGGTHPPAASHTPPAQGVPAVWSSHVAVQQESPGSHRSPAPASSTPSPQRECPAVKATGFRRGFARTAKVPLMRAHVAASTCALSVALPGSPLHAGQVTTICVNRLRGLIRAVAVGQPLASVTCEPATVSTSVAGPPSRAMRGAVRRYRPSVQAASAWLHPRTA